MAEPELEIRRGDDRDVPAILSLMKRGLGEGSVPRTPEYWAWKHSDNPFGRSPFLVAVAGSEIIGVRVFMRWMFHVHERKVRAVRAVDTATHPDFQGRGIFTRLTLDLVNEVSSSGDALVYNTPNDKSRPGYLKMGWETVGRVSLWVRPRFLSAVRTIAVRGVTVHAREIDAMGTDIDLDAEDLRTLDFSRLRGLHESTVRYRTRIDPRYLEWRYLRCPGVQYRLVSVEPGRALVAFRLKRRGVFRELTLCDVLAERSIGGARATRATIARIMRETTPDYVACAAHALPFESRVMIGAGFVPAPSAGPVMTVRPLHVEALPDPRNGASWATSIGDLELF